MMNKEQKKNYIEEMTSKFENSKAIMVTHYQGLTMNQLDELRAKMREHGIIFKITKNRSSIPARSQTEGPPVAQAGPSWAQAGPQAGSSWAQAVPKLGPSWAPVRNLGPTNSQNQHPCRSKCWQGLD